MARIHALVKGRVQGVGFRFFTSRTANGLGLKGFVRNTSNGGVEIVAEGPKAVIKNFLNRIRDGPITSEVEDVVVKWEKEKNEFNSFEIRF